MTDSDPDLPETEEETAPSAAELEAAGQNSMFGDAPPEPVQEPAPEPMSADSKPSAQPYRVLARKYRPQTFSELVGQEPMVRTLANAIERDRLAHAFLMTGVRGVGKTSTARLIAKALNCIGPDGKGGPTIDPCGVCENCVAIAEGRHIDVIEMDAASNTGVDDVREIIDAVRYAAVSARFKIYIIDEVHMLSRNAFNALLKTLEEPPAHVKFLFATTEVEKLPVTVLSRTQRFDLRRIPASLLTEHYANVCRAEGVEAEDEALRIIANAAEGSARDGLSILDQAIAHADLETSKAITARRVRQMLGLADKGAQRRVLEDILQGDAQALLVGVDEQYALGVEPLALMRALMDLVHKITVAQVSGAEPDAPGEEERRALAEFAERLSAGQLHRLWQLLLKGHEEVRAAPDPLVALQMALLRVLHAADMPDPGSLARRIEEIGAGAAAKPVADRASSADHPTASTTESAELNWAQLVEEIDQAGQMHAAEIMRSRVRVLELAPQRLIYSRADDFPDDPGPDVREALLKFTGKRWQVEKGDGEGAPTLREQAEAEAKAQREATLSDPLVKAAFAAFPDAELIETPPASEDAPAKRSVSGTP
ncbi:MAG: DNA polymerase III subunit gamma/tau [Erythrobacter sp.]|uniref:DNA polymerase III subunit gamma/tau n=1 Tax=Erythrobacter sp. TaxID=1042 RepID=UPI00260315CC|nr:DNA polymerase III subunit gamma/tau [Erythrobacter sp.]MDJ0977154.1 DNA polymerase III subunit gamma/tau [Erythrobacter sp.]